MIRKIASTLALVLVVAGCRDSVTDPQLSHAAPPASASFTVTVSGGTSLGAYLWNQGGEAQAVNNSGASAGFVYDSVSVPHAILWTSEGATKIDPWGANLTSYSARGYAYGYGVNDVGDVVGYSFYNGTGGWPMRATRWHDGAQDLLGTLGGGYSHAYAVNNNHHVVGWASGPSQVHAFRWTPANGMQDLGVLSGGTRSDAWGINDFGTIAGSSTVGGQKYAVIWNANNVIQDLGAGAGSEAFDVNQSGQVVGSRMVEGVKRAFLWTSAGGFQDLGEGTARGINNHGIVVGIKGGGYRAFMWSASTGMVELNGAAGPGTEAEAYAVGDDGTIAGYSVVSGTTYPTKWVISGLPVLAPAAPNFITATVASLSRVDLTWGDASYNESSFRVLRRVRNPDGTLTAWQTITTLAANTTEYADVTAVTGSNYRYMVQACNGGACASSPQVGIIVDLPPAAPTNLFRTIVSNSMIRLNWTDASGNETSFKAYRRIRLEDGTLTAWSLLGSVKANSTEFRDTTAVPGTNYRYMTQACNSSGCSSSSIVSILMPLPPAAPTGVHATAFSARAVDVHWTDASTDETYFQVMRRVKYPDGSLGPWEEVGIGLADTGFYQDETVWPDANLRYMVRACHSAVCTSSSSASVVTPSS
jgi:probable HAF family extracellular repeat protein